MVNILSGAAWPGKYIHFLWSRECLRGYIVIKSGICTRCIDPILLAAGFCCHPALPKCCRIFPLAQDWWRQSYGQGMVTSTLWWHGRGRHWWPLRIHQPLWHQVSLWVIITGHDAITTQIWETSECKQIVSKYVELLSDYSFYQIKPPAFCYAAHPRPTLFSVSTDGCRSNLSCAISSHIPPGPVSPRNILQQFFRPLLSARAGNLQNAFNFLTFLIALFLHSKSR